MDPREIRVLDPACGSGHFLLYCFDLLMVIYEESYDDVELGPDLRRDYATSEAFRKAVPGLILSRNLHGIDIDPRAVQIAGLALWLRAQRAYQDMGLKKNERPQINKTCLVCAEPLPGEQEILTLLAQHHRTFTRPEVGFLSHLRSCLTLSALNHRPPFPDPRCAHSR